MSGWRERAADRRRATCSACGGVCGRWTERADRDYPQVCAACRKAVGMVRRSLFEGMWAQGWPLKVIASTLGLNPTSLASFRRRGWDLPHRYKMRDGRRVA